MAYKDSLFRSIFGNEKSALGLYNALHGTSHTEQDTKVVINTLEETAWSPRKNDLSFEINDSLVVVAEHQSTINENMPFRCLQYVCRLFEEGLRDRKAVYRQALVRHSRPMFKVFYNGLRGFPDLKRMRLSDSFKPADGFEDVNLELVVDVYNINDGHNRDILDACEELKGYAFFVARVRWHQARMAGRERKDGGVTLAAIRLAIKDCKAAGLMNDYWDELTQKELYMLSTEWDFNTALEVCEEEGIEEGREEGREERDMELLALIHKGYTPEDIVREIL